MRPVGAIGAILALTLSCGGEHDLSGRGGSAGLPPTGGGAGSGAEGGSSGSAGALATHAGVHPIVEWSSGELAPFDARVGGARVVALGESVHTSGGYSEAKARLVRHLVEVGGFRVVALESPRTDARAVDEFVQSCSGSVETAMQSMAWVFADRHMAELLQWLCEFNQTHADDRVSFVGFDVQQPWHDGPELTLFLQGLSLSGGAELAPALAGCDGVGAKSSAAYHDSGSFEIPIPAEQYDSCRAATQAIESYFDAERTAIEAEVGARALALARLALLGISAWEEAKYELSIDPKAAHQARDSAMSTVMLESLRLDHPDARAVMWAHNFHVRQRSQVSQSYPMGVRCTGTLLQERLGDDYAAFGFVSKRTETNWPGVSCGWLPAAGPNDLESLLADLDESALLVDLADPELSWVEPGASYGFGLNAGGDFAVPAEQFRGLFWLEESPAMESVLGPSSCGP